MNLSGFSLKRPVFTIVVSVIIVLFGLVGYKFLGVREYPAIDPPIVSVKTNYTGANADIIESQITEPLEKAINGISGIRTISSTSQQGTSNITVEFNLGVDLDNAAGDVRDKVSQSLKNLPQDIDAPPAVNKSDANGDFIIVLAVQSHSMGLLELSDYSENVLLQQLQTIPGISSINIFGQKRFAMRIWADPSKMAAHNLTFDDIQAALNLENAELPAGKIYGNNTELSILAKGNLSTPEEFRQIILKESPQGIIRLGDVARVELGPEALESTFRLNGAICVGLALVPQPGSNYIDIANEFYKRLDALKADKKNKDIELSVTYDSTLTVKKSLNDVLVTLLIAFGLVILVIFLFFRNALIAIRPLIDIPISLIGSFFIMYLMGYSVNILTMLAVVLATGLVVDDGIVVTENIFRKLEEGLPIRQAAYEGSKEIFFAVIATSITLAIVFIPVIFLQGFTGSLFREFGIVIAGAVLISAFVSLTLTPVLNVLLTGKKAGHGKFYQATEPFFSGMENGYKKLLTRIVEKKWIAIVLVLICLGTIYFVGGSLPSELAPLEDRSSIRFQLTAPEGTSYEAMDVISNQLEQYLTDSIPETQSVFAAVPSFNGTGSNASFARMLLVPPKDRKRSQNDITNFINNKLSQFNQARIFAVQEQTIAVGISSKGALPVQFVIQNLSFDKLQQVIPAFMDSVRKDKTFLSADVNLKFNKPELNINIDRMRAAEQQISVRDIAGALEAANSGKLAGYYKMEGRQYEVVLQVDRPDRSNPDDLKKIYLRNGKGDMIPLSSLVNITETSEPPSLYHFNRYKSATIQAALAPGKTVGDGIKAMRAIAAKTLDDTFQSSLTGSSRDFEESAGNTNFALILALVLIYLVLAAQFESFRDPMVIMVTVPLALAGALLSLFVFHQTINIFSQIGMIMLIGLVTKNGILIVEFSNQKRAHGLSKLEAVIEAASARLRPILMTSLATSFGALPIALSLGSSASSRVPLGIVLVGGITFSLILTLFVIPTMYLMISAAKRGPRAETPPAQTKEGS